jgi:hypothetical protein
MAFDFPSSPSTGQVYLGYTWDGQKWLSTLAASTAMLTTGGQTITGGYRITPYNAGTRTAGQTFTPDAFNGNYQYYSNGGAHTFATPANDCAVDVMVNNVSGAGAISFPGYSISSNVGDPLTTTVGHYFIISLRRINGVSTFTIKALQ